MSDDFDLFERAVSKKQQRLMGAVHAYQKDGTLPKSAEFAAKIRGIADGGQKKKRETGRTKGMSNKDAKKFAKTKHKGLPETVSETFAQFVEHSGDDWVHRSYEERVGQARLGKGLLKKVRSLGPTSRREPASWSHDVKRRAFRTVRDALKGRFTEAVDPNAHGRNPEYHNLEQTAQAVWATSDLDEKRRLLHEMIDSFKFKEQQVKHRRAVDTAKTGNKLDYLASGLALADDKVIKVGGRY